MKMVAHPNVTGLISQLSKIWQNVFLDIFLNSLSFWGIYECLDKISQESEIITFLTRNGEIRVTSAKLYSYVSF